MAKKRVTFKLPLVKRRKMKGGDGDKPIIGVAYSCGCPHCDAIMYDDGKSGDCNTPLPQPDSIWQKAKNLIGDTCDVKEYPNGDSIPEGVNVDGYPTIFKKDKDGVTYFSEDRTPEKIQEFAIGASSSGEPPIQTGGKRKRKTARRRKSRKSGWFW